ncbi:hypothetical protein [Burkholderia sp. MSMB1835]|uniref:hypothetical protein n=1 Tax=Burkholderia sp. MSMB1835 TaxID=1637876 RepID=UPI00211D1CF1|nr:hypothetical protein [Burkholderia sp. MSMB1835]
MAGFNEIESGQKVVRASFGAAQNAESPRVARHMQHDLRRDRARRGRPIGASLPQRARLPVRRFGGQRQRRRRRRRRRRRAFIVVAFHSTRGRIDVPAPARSTRSFAPIAPVCIDLASARAAAGKQANRPIRAATALAE